jgi:type IV/VI secretion system ImpK/VasF family protein|tara:strand:- start:251 stop:958 length:708 start_codon:yes stop_codon:yes gene_type:complete
MNLIEICEPVWQYICKINRIARNQGSYDYQELKEEIQALIEQLNDKASQEALLSKQYEVIKMPILFFVDSMIVESGISCCQEWDENRLAYDFNELAGDESFFDTLEDALMDHSQGSEDVLAFYYVCLGLGFKGFYMHDEDFIRQKLEEVMPRIRNYLQSNEHSLITPEAYEVNTSNFPTPIAPKIWGMLFIFIGVAAAVFITSIFLYFKATNDLAHSITTISAKEIVAEEIEELN